MALPRVFFDLTAGGNPVGRITMEVRAKLCDFQPLKFERISFVDKFQNGGFYRQTRGGVGKFVMGPYFGFVKIALNSLLN